jgi:hypothetical protein
MVAEIHAVAAAVEPDEIVVEPSSIIRLKSKPKTRQKRVVLFYIDEVAYSVPAKPGAEVSLQILDAMERLGQEGGIAFMLKRMLGEEGYQALMTYDDLDTDDLQQIIVKANAIVNGALEGPKER